MKPSVYVTILNLGQIRAEYPISIVPRLLSTKGVTVIIEDLKRTQNVPLVNNRSQIRQRFLSTNCDYLLMLDDDIVPNGNPAELVKAEKDIIGCPYLIWKKKINRLVWTAWIWHNGGYRDIDIDTIKISTIELFMPVDVIGLGCSLIRRDVLKKIDNPFKESFDNSGKLIWGEEFAFCSRARGMGYGVFTTPKSQCEHYKTVGLKKLKGSIQKGINDSSTTKTIIR